MGLYGNINNINKSVFQFDKIYSSRFDMEDKCASDEVFIGRYVLIKYEDRTVPSEDTNKEGYRAEGYDGTVWQKVYNSEKSSGVEYVLIAELNTLAPALKFVTTPPSNAPTWMASVNPEESGATLYTITLPAAWGFTTGQIDFNEAGFDPETGQEKINEETGEKVADSITLNKISNTTNFPITDINGKTSEDENWIPTYAEDTYQLDINLPSIGNTIAKIWDIIYGTPSEDTGRRNTNIFGEGRSLAEVHNELTTSWNSYQTELNNEFDSYQTELNNEFDNLENSWNNYQKYLTGNTEIPDNLDENWIGEFNNLENDWNDYQLILVALRNELQQLKGELEQLRGSVVEDSEHTLSTVETNWQENTIYKIRQNEKDVGYYYLVIQDNGNRTYDRIENDTIWKALLSMDKAIREKVGIYVDELSQEISDEIQQIWRSITESEFKIDDDWDLDSGKDAHAVQKHTLVNKFNEKADLESPIFTGTPQIEVRAPKMQIDEDGNQVSVVDENDEPVMDLIGRGNILTDLAVDNELNEESNNPVQNKVIFNKIKDISNELENKINKDTQTLGENIVFENTPKVKYEEDIVNGYQYQEFPVITEKTLGPRIFIATFGKTNIENLRTAYNANEILVCTEQPQNSITENFYQLFSAEQNLFRFFRCDTQGYTVLTCSDAFSENQVNGWEKISGNWDGTNEYTNHLFVINYNDPEAGPKIQGALDDGKIVVCRYTVNEKKTANYFYLTYHNATTQSYNFRCFTSGYYYQINYNNNQWKATTYVTQEQAKDENGDLIFDENNNPVMREVTRMKQIWFEPFWAEVDVTTFEAINTAYANGQMVLCKATDESGKERIFHLDNINGTQAQFVAIDANRNFTYLTCAAPKTWTVSQNVTLEGRSSAEIVYEDTIKQNSTNAVQSKAIYTALSGKASTKLVDTSSNSNGLMSVDDKRKLDGIAAGAQVNSITGVKGGGESTYRTGNVNITKGNLGLANVENKSSATIRGELTKSNVTTALGYTPATTDTASTSAAGLMSKADKIRLDEFTQIKEYLDYTKGASNCVWLQDTTACWVYNYNKTKNLCMVTFTFKILTPDGTINSRYIISNLPKAKFASSCILTNAAATKQLMAYVSTGGNLIASADLSPNTTYYGNVTYLCSNPNTWYSSVSDPR